MPAFTPEIDNKLKSLVQSFKLQFDFAVAADMNDPQDILEFALRNHTTANTMIDVMKAMGLTLQPGQSDADLLNKIADIAAENGSSTEDDLRSIAKKVHAVNEGVQKLAQEKLQSGQKPNGTDMNRVFKKFLSK